MTKTTRCSLPAFTRLFAVAAALAVPTLANAAPSTLALGDPETYALLAAGLGMVLFMASRRGSR